MRKLSSQAITVIDVWPDNWLTWETFRAMDTQWNLVVGLGGAAYIGLRHEAVPEAMETAGVPKKKRQQVRKGIRVMEAAALAVLNERDEQAE